MSKHASALFQQGGGLSVPELLGNTSIAPAGDRKIVRLIRDVEKLPTKKQRRIAEYAEYIDLIARS